MKMKVDFNNCRPSDACPDGEEARCVCGGLVARLVAEGVELKCRRCRRIIVVPLLEGRAGAAPTTAREGRAGAAPTITMEGRAGRGRPRR
jgi:hypothetical protein